tara:strand:+ start:4161 stop:4673 length:513 start_codon:yes stop_codon:yes gene_type:complete
MFKEYQLGETLNDLNIARIQIKKDFEGTDIKSEDILRFKVDLLYDLVEGIHTWTVRYKPDVIRWPCNRHYSQRNLLPASVPGEDNELYEVGTVVLPKMVVGHVRDWPEDHEAIFGSGWHSKEHMIEGISNIYEPFYGKRLDNDSILGAYALKDFKLYESCKEGYEKLFPK